MKTVRLKACLLLLVGGVSATAGPITFSFTGAIDNDPFSVFGSATFSGSYTFASNTPQILNTANSGGYAGSGGIYMMTVSFLGTIGGALDGMPFSGETLNITVNNNFPGPLDQYLVTGTSTLVSGLSIELALNDTTGTAFSNTSLPLAPPSLGSFSLNRFALFAGTIDNPIEAEGALRTLTCTSGCSGAAVPEPGALPLVGGAVGVLLWWGRRRVHISKTN